MDFGFDARTLDLRKQLLTFMDERVYPAEAVYTEQVEAAEAQGQLWERVPVTADLKAEARSRGLWNLFLTGKAAQAVRKLDPSLLPDPQLTNLQYAAAGRDHRMEWRAGARGHQLRRPRHRQHGSAGRVRLAGPAGPMARPAARGQDQVRLLHDRARRGLQRRHQHRHRDHAGRRRLRDQRPQVVVERRDELGLQDLHRDGGDRRAGRRRRQEPQPSLHDPGAARHAGNHGQARHEGLRLHRRDARRPRGGRLRQRPGARGRT